MSEQLVNTEFTDNIYTITLNRPEKRNAISDRLLGAVEQAFENTPEGTRVIILAGAGKHFCAGLDLSELQYREPFGVTLHSRDWHRIFDRIAEGSGAEAIKPHI